MVLEITEVSKSFGGLQVLFNISLKIASREIIGLIGPNGAGKSTLFNLITGIYRPNSGSIRMGERELVGLPSHKICKLGITRTFQMVKVFPSLSVLDNVRAGELFVKKKESKPPLSPVECLELVGLENRIDSPISHMTFCDRRRVEVARAVASGPDLLLLDEPLAGLNASESQTMTEVIGKIRDETGAAIFWVEHKMDAIFGLCDQLVVLNFGQKIAEGTPKEIAGNEKVINAYLGAELGTVNA